MDIDTQYQNSNNTSGDRTEGKVDEEEGDKLNHNDQVMSNGSVEGQRVAATEKISVEQGRKKKTSVPAWRLVVCLTIIQTLASFNDSTQMQQVKNVTCALSEGCNPLLCTKPVWNNKPDLSVDCKTVRKDTAILPTGNNYVVINFISNNPGFWFLHCHIKTHQLQGMALILNEALDQQLSAPADMNQCGDFSVTMDEYASYTKSAYYSQ